MVINPLDLIAKAQYDRKNPSSFNYEEHSAYYNEYNEPKTAKKVTSLSLIERPGVSLNFLDEINYKPIDDYTNNIENIPGEEDIKMEYKIIMGYNPNNFDFKKIPSIFKKFDNSFKEINGEITKFQNAKAVGIPISS